ncbi:MAG: sulfatase-like hydrolase/transferase [Nocardioidaceae bacterium]
MQIWLPNTPYENAAMTEVERQRAVSIYAWDVQFGRIVRALRKAGRYDNTVFIFTSDNGYYLGEHRQPQGKINGHEPSIRVPLVIAGPGVAHGTTFAPASTIDLPSTILEIAGAPPRGGTDGVSSAPRVGRPQSRLGAPDRDRGSMYGMPASPEVYPMACPAQASAPAASNTSAIRRAKKSSTTCSMTPTSWRACTTIRHTPTSRPN